MRIVRMTVLALLLMAVIGCSSSPESGESVTVTKDGVTVVEVESFKLTNAEVQELAGASGGKIVVLQDESSKAETTVQMEKGSYSLTLYSLGPSQDEDASYMKVGDDGEERIYPEDVESILPTQDVYYTQEADGPCSIVITFAEENVQLDRIEIKSTE